MDLELHQESLLYPLLVVALLLNSLLNMSTELFFFSIGVKKIPGTSNEHLQTGYWYQNSPPFRHQPCKGFETFDYVCEAEC